MRNYIDFDWVEMRKSVALMAFALLLIAGLALVSSLWTPTISATNEDIEWYQSQSESRTSQSVETIIATTAGLTATYTAIPTDGVYFSNDGATFLHVKNTSGSVMTVTVQTQLTVNGLAVDDLDVPIADGQERFIGPFPTTAYNVQSGTYENTTYVDPSSYSISFTLAILTF